VTVQANPGRRSRTYNDVTQRYLDAFAAQNELTGQQLRERVLTEMAGTWWGGGTLTRPVFLERSEWQQLGEDMETVVRLVTSLPDKLFGGDLAAFAAAVGVTPVQVQAVLRGRGNRPSRAARFDAYRDEQGFRVMELNMSSAIGGVDVPRMNQAMLEFPFMEKFVTDNNLGYKNMMAEVIEMMSVEHNVPMQPRPVVAFCDFPATWPSLESHIRSNVPIFEQVGVDPIPCHIGELRLEDDGIWHGDRRIDAIYRLFVMEDLLTPDGPALIEPVLQAAERGHVALFTPMDTELYSSKGSLALLSDEANRHLFSPEELATLDRFIPWTRMVRRGPVTVAGRTVPLEEYAMSSRQELILKPTLLHGGAGVVPGWEVEPEEWQRLLEDAYDEPFILQHRVRPRAEPFPKADGSGFEDMVLLWGTFLGAHTGFGGATVRGTTNLDVGVLNLPTGAIGGCCFHELD
jgi:hypothetical protein